MPASRNRGSGSAQGIASPTIAETLETFLAETGRSRGARRQAEFEAAAGLLVECLNGYAHQGLSKEDTALWRRHYDAGGEEHREFCEVFGPEHLLPNLGEFLGWFMVRKVIGPKYLMKAAGDMTRDLARWLGEKGYASAEDAREAAARGAEAARDLPQAETLALFLYDLTGDRNAEDYADMEEGQFTVTKVEPGRLRLEHPDGRDLGAVPVPRKASDLCREGWAIAGAIGRRGGRWHLVDAWNVYPG